MHDLDWCLDSGATDLMVSDEALFHEFIDYSSTSSVIICSRDKLKISKIGII